MKNTQIVPLQQEKCSGHEKLYYYYSSVTSSDVTRNISQDVEQGQASEPEVITDLSLLPDPDMKNLLSPCTELLMYQELSDEDVILLN